MPFDASVADDFLRRKKWEIEHLLIMSFSPFPKIFLKVD